MGVAVAATGQFEESQVHDVQPDFGQALARVCPVELRLEEPFAQRLPVRYVFRTAPVGLEERQVDVLAAVMQEFGEHGCFWSAVDWQDPMAMSRTWKPVGAPRYLDRLSAPEYLAVRSEFQPEILISEEGRWGLMAGYDLEFAIFAGVESFGMRLREMLGLNVVEELDGLLMDWWPIMEDISPTAWFKPFVMNWFGDELVKQRLKSTGVS